MRKNLLLLPLAALLAHFLSAQNLPICPVGTPPADLCADACLYCNLDGYHGSTAGYTGQTPPGFCGTIENEQWFGFASAAQQATISATPMNCTNGDGIQLALYTDCSLIPIACDGGDNGGGDSTVSITMSLIPGNNYYLMVDGWAGDQCSFTLHVDPPWAAQSNVDVQTIKVCPDQTYSINGVAYSAPNSIPVIVPGQGGNCDSATVYNLVQVQTDTIIQQFELCQNEGVMIGGVEYFAPDTILIYIQGTTNCDTLLEYDLLYKPPLLLTHTIAFCPGEPVSLLGATYFEPVTVFDTLPGNPFCDTIMRYDLVNITDPASCPSCSQTWMKVIGQNGQDVRGYGIYDAPNGNFYVTGAKQDSALIMNVDVAGRINWSFCFDIAPGQNDNIAEIITDAEGMLAGCGQSGDSMPGLTGFAFRLDPVTKTMLWTRVFSDDAPFVNGILPYGANGNYLVYFNQKQGSNNTGLVAVDKSNGSLLVSPFSKKFNVGLDNGFNSIVSVNGELYCQGYFSTDQSAENRRSSLTRLDNFGDVSFSLINHVPFSAAANLSGADLLVENNTIFSVAYGNDNGANLGSSQIFMYNHLPSGTLAWSKRIDLIGSNQEAIDEIISVSDGFVLYGHSLSANGHLFLIKTDKNGVYQWSKQLDYGSNDHFQPYSKVQSQIRERGSFLFFTGTTTDSTGRSRLLLLKTTADGILEGDCTFLADIPAVQTNLSSPTNAFPPGFMQLPPSLSSEPASSSAILTLLKNKKACGVVTTIDAELMLCPGETFVVAGTAYTAPAVVSDTIAGMAGCDTIISFKLLLKAAPALEETIEFCPGASVTIGGVVYSQPGTVTDTLPAAAGCDTLVTYHLVQLPQPERSETIEFCPGASVTIGGVVYSQPGTVTDTVQAATSCDTLVTYHLVQLPQPERSETIEFCPGATVNIGGVVYSQPGTVTDTLPAVIGCDTVVTYQLVQLPQPVRSETIEFCPGATVNIGGAVYSQPGTVTDTLPAAVGCDTVVTYQLVQLPQPVRSETIEFCSGTSVTISGVAYTQPGIVTVTLPADTGCDTLATYHLEFASTPNSSVSLSCPANISQVADAGSGAQSIPYAPPVAQSDCECPGIAILLTQGLPSGAAFPVGLTQVCYQAKDSCGNTADCCFHVQVEETSACDAKVVGCMKYELLSITKEAGGSDYTYRIRVTNNCSSKLIYTAIQVPSGVTALLPANNSLYLAPSGRDYFVRNPNYAPFYSIRFKSGQDSIFNGQSDIFEYVIPGQAPPAYIHLTSKLANQGYYEAHLNTFYCPVGVTPVNRSSPKENTAASLYLFPNPTSGALFADLSGWEGQIIRLRISDSRGREIGVKILTALDAPQEIPLHEGLPNGLYFMEIWLQNGERQSARFVVQH